MQRGADTNSPRRPPHTGEHSMATIRPGYFRLPPTELGATLIFVPAYTRGLSVLELTLWAQGRGFGEIAYVPAKPKLDTGVQA